PSPRHHPGPPRAFGRRRRRAGWPYPASSHGREFLRARRRRHGTDRHRPDVRSLGVTSGLGIAASEPMAQPSTLHRSLELAGTLPALMVAADRVAATVIQGVHGRRRVGQGDAFWQYRPYRDGDSASQIDWRQSARSRHLFVRETEWEAAASVWLWSDASPSMPYASLKNIDTKAVRAEWLVRALASLLTDASERVAVLGSGMRPTSGRVAVR